LIHDSLFLGDAGYTLSLERFTNPSTIEAANLLTGSGLVTTVDLGRWRSRLDCRKGFKDPVSVGRSFGHYPAVARLKQHHLALDV
jgi:hypothetical protein